MSQEPTKKPKGPVGGEHHTDHPHDDKAFRGRHGGPDIDIHKREKELKKETGR